MFFEITQTKAVLLHPRNFGKRASEELLKTLMNQGWLGTLSVRTFMRLLSLEGINIQGPKTRGRLVPLTDVLICYDNTPRLQSEHTE